MNDTYSSWPFWVAKVTKEFTPLITSADEVPKSARPFLSIPRVVVPIGFAAVEDDCTMNIGLVRSDAGCCTDRRAYGLEVPCPTFPVKLFTPEKVLLSASKVVEAAAPAATQPNEPFVHERADEQFVSPAPKNAEVEALVEKIFVVVASVVVERVILLKIFAPEKVPLSA